MTNSKLPIAPMRTTLLSITRLAALALCSTPALATAQSAPKWCVAVARDPDTAARALALRIERMIASNPAVRSVADDRTRAALRGEPVTDPSLLPLLEARRALNATSADVAPLTTIADALGCTAIATVTATPRGFSIRRFDVIARSFDAPSEAADFTDDELSRRLTLAAHESSARSAPASASDAGMSTPISSTMTTSGAVERPTTPPVATPPSSASSAASTTPAPGSSASSRAGDPRVTVQTTPEPRRSTPVWAWVIAGVAGAGLVGAFIAAQSIGPSVPLVRVSGPGASP